MEALLLNIKDIKSGINFSLCKEQDNREICFIGSKDIINAYKNKLIDEDNAEPFLRNINMIGSACVFKYVSPGDSDGLRANWFYDFLNAADQSIEYISYCGRNRHDDSKCYMWSPAFDEGRHVYYYYDFTIMGDKIRKLTTTSGEKVDDNLMDYIGLSVGKEISEYKITIITDDNTKQQCILEHDPFNKITKLDKVPLYSFDLDAALKQQNAVEKERIQNIVYEADILTKTIPQIGLENYDDPSVFYYVKNYITKHIRIEYDFGNCIAKEYYGINANIFNCTNSLYEETKLYEQERHYTIPGKDAAFGARKRFKNETVYYRTVNAISKSDDESGR